VKQPAGPTYRIEGEPMTATNHDADSVGSRTLHVGLRVADIDRSVAFYGALGYQVVGEVPGTGIGDLTMLKLPADPFVTLELVHVPGQQIVPEGISHLVIQVESLSETAAFLTGRGTEVEDLTVHEPRSGFTTAMLTDPDGYRIELVQWPVGHPLGMTAGDFANEAP